MVAERVEQDFSEAIAAEVRIRSQGVDRFRVLTPFTFSDGDHLRVVLRREGDQWLLSDESHTYMHLSYELDERDMQSKTRQRIINSALAMFGVQDCNGELLLPVEPDRYGDALYSFIQALLQISDVTYLSRERVRSTFLEDFEAFLTETVPEERRQFRWHDPVHDRDDRYRVDCRINVSERPLFVYALHTEDRVRDANIALLKFESWDLRFRSLGIFQNQEEVNRAVLARFTDVCERQFSTLQANQDRVSAYIEEAMSAV